MTTVRRFKAGIRRRPPVASPAAPAVLRTADVAGSWRLLRALGDIDTEVDLATNRGPSARNGGPRLPTAPAWWGRSWPASSASRTAFGARPSQPFQPRWRRVLAPLR